MGRFNELLNTGAQYGRGLGILLGLQEQEGVTTSAPEVMTIYSPDLQTDRLAAIGYVPLIGVQLGLAAGGVGNRSQIALDNPAGSNQVVTFEHLKAGSGTAETLIVSYSATQLTTSTGNLVARDTRQITTAGFSAPSSARIRTQNNAALSGIATEIDRLTVSIGSQDFLMDIVLGPGTSVRIYATADNAAIASNLCFYARSRLLNVRELTL